jgi:hypothetical protein
MIFKRQRGYIAIAIMATAGVVGVTAGATTGLIQRGNIPVPVSALNSPALVPTSHAADSNDLADAVGRWNSERPSTAPGVALTARATDLLSGVGRERDTLTAFATRRGWVCYEIAAAGTCGKLDLQGGVSFALLYTRAGGTRLYGVAADKVARVQVDVAGTLTDATLQNNGLYYQLPEGVDGDAVARVMVTWKDGSEHAVHVHG